jgi:hypothetical protein
LNGGHLERGRSDPLALALALALALDADAGRRTPDAGRGTPAEHA